MSNKKGLEDRLAMIEGHIRSVRNMVSNGEKECIDVIIQLMAIERSVKAASVLLLKSHLNSCIKETAGQNEAALQKIEEFNKILEVYL